MFIWLCLNMFIFIYLFFWNAEYCIQKLRVLNGNSTTVPPICEIDYLNNLHACVLLWEETLEHSEPNEVYLSNCVP